jgi:type II secretory pathway component PulM
VLRDRERRLLAAGGAAALLILLLSFRILPDLDKIRSNGRAKAAAEKDLAELRTAVPQLRALEEEIRSRRDQVRAGGAAGESPLSKLTARLQEAGFPQSSFSIKSGGTREGEYFREESFDIRIESRSYLEIVNFLRRIEDGSMPVAIRSVGLKSRYENSSAIDAVLRIGYVLPPR